MKKLFKKNNNTVKVIDLNKMEFNLKIATINKNAFNH